ncbi:hypothetical protein ES704_01040 [subsurface metagenome]|jgi:hypothetical protein
MKSHNKRMKMDILRACGFGRKAARYLVDDATDEVIQKAGVRALTNMENEKASIKGEKEYREKLERSKRQINI